VAVAAAGHAPMFRGSRTWWYLWELDRQTMLLAIDTPEEFPEFEDAARSVLTSLRPAD
jgi:hypothetical protein